MTQRGEKTPLNGFLVPGNCRHALPYQTQTFLKWQRKLDFSILRNSLRTDWIVLCFHFLQQVLEMTHTGRILFPEVKTFLKALKTFDTWLRCTTGPSPHESGFLFLAVPEGRTLSREKERNGRVSKQLVL